MYLELEICRTIVGSAKYILNSFLKDGTTVPWQNWVRIRSTISKNIIACKNVKKRPHKKKIKYQ